MSINNVSFGAKPINEVIIKNFNKKTGKFKNYPATFVKLESNNNDLSAIDSCAETWRNAQYVKKIATASHWMDYKKYVQIEVYALTTQQKNFDRLDYKKILGLAEIRTEKTNPNNKTIYHLQVKPEAINIGNKNDKQYKHVGTKIIKSLQKIYKDIALFADKKSLYPFYKKLGFVLDYNGQGHFAWSSNVFRRFVIYFKKIMYEFRYGPFVGS